jgi:hypothetical protein
MTKLPVKLRKSGEKIKSDKAWLTLIVSWCPEKGISLVEQARWFRLAIKINELPDELESELELSDKEIVAIEDRIINPEFKLMGLSIDFANFVVDLKSELGLKRIALGLEE